MKMSMQRTTANLPATPKVRIPTSWKDGYSVPFFRATQASHKWWAIHIEARPATNSRMALFCWCIIYYCYLYSYYYSKCNQCCEGRGHARVSPFQ
mmetsp:Transcript_18345/g.15650  ORF Transcript_18345/g.15650 Transcript_18345/m.15650 type:complete len:95 (-) Transcript_18345:84-368(-)